eukprot:scaffold54475_cov69-Phaeocystis_antarctica.AAC.2
MPHTRGALYPPRRLKVTYEAPTRTRAKVQQSIDARSARLDAPTVTAHTLTTRSHATRSHATRSHAALESLTREPRPPSVLGRGRRAERGRVRVCRGGAADQPRAGLPDAVPHPAVVQARPGGRWGGAQ